MWWCNPVWADRLFFVRHRGGAEWGFPTVIRSTQKDSFPKLIQDEARASDSLLRAGVRNGEGYVTEFLLVKYGLSKPWIAEELEVGRDQEANQDFAEQIPVLAHMVYEGDDVAAVVRVPSAVRVGTVVTTALVAPPPAEERPAKARASEKGPGRIRLKKKATKEVVTAGARTPSEKGDGASHPSASTRRRPVLFDESAEEAEELRARKRKKTVQATPPRDEERTEGEEEEVQLLLRRRNREPSDASNVGSVEHGAASNTVGASSRRSGEVAVSPARREEDADAVEVSAPARVVASSAAASAPSATPPEGQEVAPAIRAPATTTGTSEELAATVGGILPPMPPTEAVANVNATSTVVEGAGGEAAGAGGGVRAEESDDDRRPLSEALLKRPLKDHSVAALEATLRRMENAPRELPASPTASHLDQLARCLDLPSERTPERTVEGYHFHKNSGRLPRCLDLPSERTQSSRATEASASFGEQAMEKRREG
ncbi:hypothetical protein Taro_019100 [Colocasia esculenta]|uniref:Uncharacterized protein n=1 Tax=Colocasia esculenta TaxID=4460 RepID=A0A843V4H2_COLES|nr:hypothetical protein [Colocasia esculenta]